MCVCLALFAAAVGVCSYFINDTVSKKFLHVSEINMPNAVTLAKMRGMFKDIQLYVAKLLIEDPKSAEFQNAITAYEQAHAKYVEIDKHYQTIPFVDGEDEVYQKVVAAWQPFSESTRKMVDLAKQSDGVDKQKIDAIFHKLGGQIEAYTNAINNLIAFQDREAEAWVASANTASKWGNTAIGALAVFAFFISVITGTFFAAGLSKRLTKIVNHLERSSSNVSTNASHIRDASTELSASSTEQAASIQEIAASVDEVNAMVTKNAENANNSEKKAVASFESANSGKAAATEMLTAIDGIKTSTDRILNQVEASNAEMGTMIKVIGEISEKAKVINQIAFQTKLLSFNASVEAARAGEHGKGFAVVAEEVCTLALTSSNAANDINSLLDASTKKVQDIIHNSRTTTKQVLTEGQQKVQEGASAAQKCSEVLENIVTSVEEVRRMVAEIALASTEQANGVVEINRAMSQMDQVTQQNSATSQQCSNSSEQLKNLTLELQGIVAELTTALTGQSRIDQASDAPHNVVPISVISKFDKSPTKKAA